MIHLDSSSPDLRGENYAGEHDDYHCRYPNGSSH